MPRKARQIVSSFKPHLEQNLSFVTKAEQTFECSLLYGWTSDTVGFGLGCLAARGNHIMEVRAAWAPDLGGPRSERFAGTT